MGLLNDGGGAIHRRKPRFESHQQIMQGRERCQRYLRCPDLEAGAIDRVELPRRYDRDSTRRQLDMDDRACCALLTLNAARTLPKQRMPRIVDNDVLPDMGRMTVRFPWPEKLAVCRIR